MIVWTKQDIHILDTLYAGKNHQAHQEHIESKMGSTAEIYLFAYRWLAREAAKYMPKAGEVSYPIWVSLYEQKLAADASNQVLLTLDIPTESLLVFNIDTWAQVLNYAYIPKDKADLVKHRKEMSDWGIAYDSKAFLTPFYPLMKEKIMGSWEYLFTEIGIAERKKVAIIWEVQPKWIIQIDK